MKRRTSRPQPIKPWAVQAALAETAPAPETDHQAKARRLPMPGPGIVITVPLDCLMEYLAMYNLAPYGSQEPKAKPANGPGEAILLVKHLKGDANG